jgi:UDP-N-acetylglucosamine transferase subunit ALG13
VVFVTVGTGNQQFLRLLEAVDELAGQGAFGSEEVFVQFGNNQRFVPTHVVGEPFLSMTAFDLRLGQASLLICHGGCGTIMAAVRRGLVPVAMPCLRRYGEAVNDHQVELIRQLADGGLLVPAWDVTDLAPAIRSARMQQQNPRPSSAIGSGMIGLVRRTVDAFLAR